MDAMEDRVRSLEKWKEGAELRFMQLSSDLRANTDMTASVKNDTAQLVEFFNASRVNMRVLRWLAGLSAAFAAIYAAWRQTP